MTARGVRASCSSMRKSPSSFSSSPMRGESWRVRRAPPAAPPSWDVSQWLGSRFTLDVARSVDWAYSSGGEADRGQMLIRSDSTRRARRPEGIENLAEIDPPIATEVAPAPAGGSALQRRGRLLLVAVAAPALAALFRPRGRGKAAPGGVL